MFHGTMKSDNTFRRLFKARNERLNDRRETSSDETIARQQEPGSGNATPATAAEQLHELLNSRAAYIVKKTASHPHAQARTNAPLQLENMRAAAPCPVAWSEMSGDDKVRWSDRCQHFVYNPAGLTEEELAALIWFREGIKPATLYARKDGMIVSSNCRKGSARALRNSLAIGSVLSSFAILIVITFSGSANQAPAQLSAQPGKPAPVQTASLRTTSSTATSSSESTSRPSAPVRGEAVPHSNLPSDRSSRALVSRQQDSGRSSSWMANACFRTAH